MKIKTSFLVLIAILMVFNTSKAEDKKIHGCSEALEVIKFTQDERYSIVLSKNNRIFVSTDQISWVDALTVGYPNDLSDVEIIDDQNLFAVGDQGLAIRSTDGGRNWVKISGLPEQNFTKVKYIDHSLWILGTFGTVLRSEDLGQSFQNFSRAITGSFMDIAFTSQDQGFMVSDQTPSFWITTNSGANWLNTDLPQDASGMMIFSDQEFIYVGGSAYILSNPSLHSMLFRIKVEDLDEWEAIPLPESFKISGAVIKEGKGGLIMNKSHGEVWKTTSAGMTWIPSQQSRKFHSIAMRGNQLYIASDSGTIVLLDVVLGISSINNEIPLGYSLSQNYPNPFNPSTKINFSIPKSGNVRLAVYNTAGKEVAVLLNNQSLLAGNYTVDFDASNLTNGAYFYTLRSESYFGKKLMVLIK
jgi:photosystem II stability/assembly factor-like uncharacterized protein